MIAGAAVEPIALALALAYLACGGVTAVLLGRRGHRSALALGALACWPLLLPLVREPARAAPSHGPLHERIARAIAALRDAMDDPAAAAMHLPDDLDGLADELYRADERLAMVDRLLAQVASTTAPSRDLAEGIAGLQRARAATAAEIEAVLDGAAQLRLQIGLRALAGNSFPVQERLRDLRGRLAAIDELAALELHT